MAIFDDLPGLISEVLGDLGLDEGLGVLATYTHCGDADEDADYDLASGTVDGDDDTTETLRVIFEDVRGKDLVEGLVVITDKKVLIPGADMASPPKIGDTITANGETYTVIHFIEVRPGAEVVLYELFVRAS